MIWCVIPAAGRGLRFGAPMPKQYAPLVGVPMLVRTMDRLAAHPQVAGLMVALSADDQRWPGIELLEGKPVRTCIGGAERADSVLSALVALTSEQPRPDWVMVHDAARPCVRHSDIDALIAQGQQHVDGAILAAPVRDSLKQTKADAVDAVVIESSVDRNSLWRALTPQLFRFDDLLTALKAALADPLARHRITDEASAIEHRGGHPLLVPGADDNIKVTSWHDLALAEFILTSPA